MADMPNCPDIEPLVTPYVDGVAPPADRSVVAAHLEGCPWCRDRVDAERAARHVLQSRAASLVGRAPLDLHARCAAALRAPAPQKSRRWTTARLSMAAALFLAVAGVVGYGVFGRTATALAAQLTLDHLKCFSFFEASSGPADPVELEAKLQRVYGWRLAIPPTSPDGHLQLVGARRCITADGRIAHILYRHDGRPLSLFLLTAAERPSGHVEVFGYETRIWSRAGTTFVLVAGEPDADVDRAAAYLRGVRQ
jgi:anti-sigma factor RsiW